MPQQLELDEKARLIYHLRHRQRDLEHRNEINRRITPDALFTASGLEAIVRRQEEMILEIEDFIELLTNSDVYYTRRDSSDGNDE